MKDIDEIIVAYQGLRIEGDRADALERLTGNPAGSKRDTLAVLQGGSGCQRETKVLHQDALRLLNLLPPLPKRENAEYPVYNHNLLDGEDERRLSEWVEEQSQQFIPIMSRWSTTSAGSSVYSRDTVCSSGLPSLYHHDSRSSSPVSGTSAAEPASPSAHYFPSKPNSTHATVPFWSLGTMKLLPNESSLASSRTNSPTRQPSSRSTMPTRASKPPDASKSTSRNVSLRPRGRSRMHLFPTVGWHVNVDTTSILHLLRPVPSSSQISRAPSVKSTIVRSTPDRMRNDRPCKQNNYLGFCKGAWAARQDTNNGLTMAFKPAGMFTTRNTWQCRHCSFAGTSSSVPDPTKKNKREIVIDPKIRVSAAGIRYRWSFLAKSHVKKSTYSFGGGTDGNYGCVVCSVERTVTSVYGSVETLMNHIAHEHIATGSMSHVTMERSKVIIGRVAGDEEDWDVNIPSREELLF